MGKLYVIGIGPGNYENLTIRADRALLASEIIAGYTVYVDLIKQHYPDKEFLETKMTREAERCHMALEKAKNGRTVSLVCSGDAAVYAMAGLVYELLPEYEGVEVEIIPGVTAALSGGAVLGAPLTNDFAVVSLSDLLTPWETIEKRLAAVANGDFCAAIYNPSSKKRADYLKRACEILLKKKSPDTVCGIVKNIGREGEAAIILTLGELLKTPTDMFSTVFIGNKDTVVIDGHMVTKRGYRI